MANQNDEPRSECNTPNKENENHNSDSRFSYSDSDTDEWNKSNKKKQLVTNTDGLRPRRRPRKVETPTPTYTVSIPSHVIARRNERERHRVQQVNNSFAVLRSRIPNFTPDGEEGRKKLSKVETLRMAVDYIQHLEVLLNIKGESSRDDDSDVSSECHSSYVKSEVDAVDLSNQTDAKSQTEDVGQMQDLKDFDVGQDRGSDQESVSSSVILPPFSRNNLDVTNFVYGNFGIQISDS